MPPRRTARPGRAAAQGRWATRPLSASIRRRTSARSGDGGAVVTSDGEAAEVARTLRSYGEVSQYERCGAARTAGSTRCRPPFSRVELRHVDDWNERRREIAAQYSAAAADAAVPAPADPPGGRHVYHLYVLSVPDRDAFRARLAEAGVQTLVHYPRAVHQHEPYRDLARVGDLSVSERLAATVVSLPLYPELEDDEVRRGRDALRATTARNGPRTSVS